MIVTKAKPVLIKFGLSLISCVIQGVLHWVAESSPGVDPLKVEVRLFDKLFVSEV